jgi:SPP1 gp7 family putative phage head morphogenesis protein
VITSNGQGSRSTIPQSDQRPQAGASREDVREPYARRGGAAALTKASYMGDSAYRWTLGLGGEPDLSKPYAQHPWVYACVAAIGRASSSVPARLDRKLPSGEMERDETSQLAKSLGMPNPLQSQRKFFRAISTSQMLYGETFLILLRRDPDGRMVPVRAANGGGGMMARIEQPEEFWPVRGDLIEAVLDPNTKLPAAWRMQTGSGQVEYPAHSVVQIAEVNPYNPLRGMGPMQAAYRTAAKDFVIDRYDEALLQNGGSPGGVLSVDGPLTDADQRAIREAWQEAHGRPESHRKTAVLPQGTEYKEIGMTPQAMEHEKLRDWDRQTILSIFGVPPVVLGLETINYATAREQNRIFWETTVLPYLDFLKDELQHKLVNRINSPDSELRLDFDITGVSALREDMDAKVDRSMRIYTEGHRSFSEAAHLAGWDISEEELDGSDERWVPSTLIPASVGATQTEVGGASPPEEPRRSVEVERAAEEIVEAAREWPVYLDTEEKRLAYWKLYTAEEDKVISKVHKRTYRVYRDLLLSVRKRLKAIAAGKKEAAASIETKAFTDAELERLLAINTAQWSELLADQIEDLLKHSQVSAAGGVAAQIGVAATISTIEDPFIVAFYADYPVYLAEGPTSDLALDIRKAILKNVSSDSIGSVNSLREAIRLTLAENLSSVDHLISILDNRADRIARTETIKANNGARVAEMKNNEIERHTWLSSRDNAVRSSHRTLDGTTVKVDEEFAYGLKFPGDKSADAGQAVNCRCTTIPVIK